MSSINVLFLLAGLAFFAPRVLATYLTIPLYMYPSNGAWQPLYDSIATNPGVTFNLIINPDSGPGSSTYPDSDTIAAIAQLNAYPNVNTLGYVHVSVCTRSLSDVQNDVKTYAGWASYTGGQDIHVSGIFFDEAPAEYSSIDFVYMQSASGFVKSAFPSGNNHVAFNPGTAADSPYFSIADNICIYEDYFADYPSNLPTTVPANQTGASTIIIYGFTGSQDQQNAIVQAVAGSEIAGLFITSSTDYMELPTLWTALVDSMAALAGPLANITQSSNTTQPSVATSLPPPSSSKPSSTLTPSAAGAPEPTSTTTIPYILTVAPLPATSQTAAAATFSLADPVQATPAYNLPSTAPYHSHHRHHWSTIQ